jgi:hypothetical protein
MGGRGINQWESDMMHFVGFRGNEFRSAVKVFGQPDFFHRVFDHGAVF